MSCTSELGDPVKSSVIHPDRCIQYSILQYSMTLCKSLCATGGVRVLLFCFVFPNLQYPLFLKRLVLRKHARYGSLLPLPLFINSLLLS